MNVAQHCAVLKRMHSESPELYLIRIAASFELDANPMLSYYRDLRAQGVIVYAAIDAVLMSFRLLPYEAYLETYVLDRGD